MALNIRNTEAEQLAAELAKATGESKTEAVRDRLIRVRRERTERRLADELEEIAEHCASISAASLVETSLAIKSGYGPMDCVISTDSTSAPASITAIVLPMPPLLA